METNLETNRTAKIEAKDVDGVRKYFLWLNDHKANALDSLGTQVAESQPIELKPKEEWATQLQGVSSLEFYLHACTLNAGGFGAVEAKQRAPEDNAFYRKLVKSYKGELILTAELEDEVVDSKAKLIAFDWNHFRQIKKLFKESMTKPNKQDWFYVVTKTFGVNLISHLAFVIPAVINGQLPMARAIASAFWYRLQDLVFTVFGQTYMKFLGRMSGFFRVRGHALGDFLFVFFQFSFMEIINRIILGPLGENPLPTTLAGIGLVFLNNFQGLISGGPISPAIMKMRQAGVISQSTMMHLYQVSSLTLMYGYFASFGYQKIYAMLTGGTMVVAWGTYLFFAFKSEPKFQKK